MTHLEPQIVNGSRESNALGDMESALYPSTDHVPQIIRMQWQQPVEEQRPTSLLSEEEARRKSLQNWIARNRLQRSRNRGWNWLRDLFR